MNSFLKFWGVRGSAPTPGPETVRYGGNTSCVELRLGGQIIILDAGTGLRLLGHSLTAEFHDAPLDLTLLISHLHWDHIQGFPFFSPAYHAGNRLRILGWQGGEGKFPALFAGQMVAPYFPVDLSDLCADILMEELPNFAFQIGEIPVRAHLLNHPGLCVGYRLETGHGAVAYLPDNEPQVHCCEIRHQDELLAEAGAKDAALEEFVRGVEILIIDSQYTAAQYPGKVGWGHADAETVTKMAVRAGGRRLFLFHHDPGQSDALIEEKLAACRRIASGTPLQIEAAREGLVVGLE